MHDTMSFSSLYLVSKVSQSGTSLFQVHHHHTDTARHTHTWKLPRTTTARSAGHSAAPQELLGLKALLKGHLTVGNEGQVLIFNFNHPDFPSTPGNLLLLTTFEYFKTLLCALFPVTEKLPENSHCWMRCSCGIALAPLLLHRLSRNTLHRVEHWTAVQNHTQMDTHTHSTVAPAT